MVQNRTRRSVLFLVALIVLTAAAASAVPSRAQAQITPLGQRGCAPGTVVGGPNLIFNGDFAVSPGPGPGIDPAAGFENGLINRGPNTYPDDGNGGGFSIQTGPVTYLDNLIIGRPFPGDPSRETPPSETYFYSNPVWPDDVTEVLLWRQTVNVVGGTTYNFYAYFDNLINPNTTAVRPVIELRVNGIAAGPPVVVPELPDAWVPVQFAFTTAPGQTSVTLSIVDQAGDAGGDDFGMTAINLKQCVSGLGLAKQATFLGRNADGTFGVEYLITARNFGSDPEPIRNFQVTDDLAAAFAGASSWRLVSVSSPTLTVNPAFDGRNDIKLLAPDSTLVAGQTAFIRIVVNVTPGSGPGGSGPFANIARATATAGAIAVSDASTPGSNPDASGDGDLKGNDRPTVITLRSVVALPLVRR